MSDETNDPPEPSPKELRREAKAALKAAERGLKEAEKTHKQAVTEAERSAAKAEEGIALAACAPYTLFADRVYTPEGTVWLEPSMHAEVDTSGDLQVEHRPTATRCCACGCIPAFFLQKKENARHPQALHLAHGTGRRKRWCGVTGNGGDGTRVRRCVQRRCFQRSGCAR